MNSKKIKEKYLRLAEKEIDDVWRTFFSNLVKDNSHENSPYLKYSDGQSLTPKEAIIAKCVCCRATKWNPQKDRCPDFQCPLFDVLSRPDFFEY